MEFVADYLKENQIANVITFICVMTILCVGAWKLGEFNFDKKDKNFGVSSGEQNSKNKHMDDIL